MNLYNPANRMLLTSIHPVAILFPLSQKTKVWIQTQRKGHNRPLYTVVFLCPSKTQAALCRRVSILVGCIEQPLKRLAGSFAGSLNLMHPTAQRVRPMGGGLSLYKGVTAMNTQHQGNTAQNPTRLYSLFNLVKHTHAGPKIICHDLTFDQATSLVIEIPSAVVKFSHMEVSL